MHKIVYNSCFGGFSLSRRAVERLAELGNLEAIEELKISEMKGRIFHSYLRRICRHDPLLVQIVEELGGAADGTCARLSIATIDGNRYRISEYDGSEDVQEPKDIDWIVIDDYFTRRSKELGDAEGPIQ